MAAPVTTLQVLKDTTEHAVIKLTASFDGSTQEANAVRIQANTLYGAINANTNPGLLVNGGNPLPYYGLSVYRIWYDCATDGDVELYWHAGTNKTIAFLNGNGEYDAAGNWITIPNNTAGTPSSNGDIGITTRGMVANSSYTIIMELRKDNAHYQRGQLTEPGAFNYPPYGVRP